MPARYELTPAAKEDVRGIWLYTAAQWGERQADRYVGLLEAGFRQIVNGRAVSRTFSQRYPHVRVTRCEPPLYVLRASGRAAAAHARGAP